MKLRVRVDGIEILPETAQDEAFLMDTIGIPKAKMRKGEMFAPARAIGNEVFYREETGIPFVLKITKHKKGRK